MNKYQMTCNVCQKKIVYGANHAGSLKPCPNCGNLLTLTAPNAQPKAPVSPAASAPMAKAAGLPERMKANKLLAGKACNDCKREIDLGDDVFNCQKCSQSFHLQCFQKSGSCPGCNIPYLEEFQPAAAQQEDSKECKYCRELIRKGARKCKHCGEYQFASDRRRQEEQQKSDSDDSKLSTSDILICVLCSGIGIIAGIVLTLMGKKRGPKMLALSFCVGMFFQVLLTLGKGR